MSHSNDLKDSQNTPESTQAGTTNVSFFLMIRVLAAGYLLYMAYQCIKLYGSGAPDLPSKPWMITGIIFLIGSSVAILIMTLRWYRRYLASCEEARQAEAAQEDSREVLPEDPEAVIEESPDKTE